MLISEEQNEAINRSIRRPPEVQQYIALYNDAINEGNVEFAKYWLGKVIDYFGLEPMEGPEYGL